MMGDPVIDGLEARLNAGEDNAPLRFELGSAYFNAGNWLKAVEHLQVSVIHDRAYSIAWKRLGCAFQALGRMEQAREALENALGAAENAGDIPTAMEVRSILNELGNP